MPEMPEMPAVHAPAAEAHKGLAGLEGLKGLEGITKGHKTEIIIIWANPGAGAETTTINEKVTVTETITKGAGGDAAATPPPAAAQHTVTVGGPGGLVYQPEELHDVPIGDTVVFEFLSQNHTVSQSGFDEPCTFMEGGMDSGFMANPNNTVVPPPQVAMQVMVDTPLCKYLINPKYVLTYILTFRRVLLQAGQPLWPGHGLLHQPYSREDTSQVQGARHQAEG
jgi:hypothetical protein